MTKFVKTSREGLEIDVRRVPNERNEVSKAGNRSGKLFSIDIRDVVRIDRYAVTECAEVCTEHFECSRARREDSIRLHIQILLHRDEFFYRYPRDFHLGNIKSRHRAGIRRKRSTECFEIGTKRPQIAIAREPFLNLSAMLRKTLLQIGEKSGRSSRFLNCRGIHAVDLFGVTRNGFAKGLKIVSELSEVVITEPVLKNAAMLRKLILKVGKALSCGSRSTY